MDWFDGCDSGEWSLLWLKDFIYWDVRLLVEWHNQIVSVQLSADNDRIQMNEMTVTHKNLVLYVDNVNLLEAQK